MMTGYCQRARVFHDLITPIRGSKREASEAAPVFITSR